MKRLVAFLDSMTGRIFVILVLGIAVAGSGALLLSDSRRQAELNALQQDRSIDRLVGFVNFLDRTAEPTRGRLASIGAEGVHLAAADLATTGDDPEMAKRLMQALNGPAVSNVRKGAPASCEAVDRAAARRFGPGQGGGFRGGAAGPGQPTDAGRGGPAPDAGQSGATPEAGQRGPGADFGRGGQGGQYGGRQGFEFQPRAPGACWLMDIRFTDGASVHLALNNPPRPNTAYRAFDPLFLSVLALVAAILAFVLARMTGAPIRKLADAARQLGRQLDREPLSEDGPREVREAAQAFNAMQRKLQHNLAERTHMLAAITHDLQTPLTRLRLRLEKVGDDTLRERLVGDLAAMQALIREGLDLARSSETSEPFIVLDLDSMLESIVEDEAGAGREASFIKGAGRDVKVRAQALKRCITNLIDNAIAYGDSAEVAANSVGDNVVVTVRDHGPGIPEDQLEAVFDPMVRLEDSRSRETGGSGLGLTIARKLAQQNGGDLTLANHPGGGCVATLTLPGLAR